VDKNVKVRIDDQYQPVSRGIPLEAGRVTRLSINSNSINIIEGQVLHLPHLPLSEAHCSG